MKLAKIVLVVTTIFSASSASVWAWGTLGHQAVAETAMTMLKGTPTESKINALLNEEAVSDAAIWLDQVREHIHFDDLVMQKEADAFNEDFPHNSNWHFTNYVIGSKAYDLTGKYSSPDDVVHALENAIAVLEGTASKMTKLQALRVVFHLVGDIHEPLHCVTGYYDLSDMNHPKAITDVSDPTTTPEDRGGNQLYYGPTQELHALWDTGLPTRIGKNLQEIVSAIISQNLTSQSSTLGDYHHWPELWATNTITQGTEAYSGITFNSAAIVKNPNNPSETMLKILISLPGGTEKYKTDQSVLAKDQLQKAAIHLAQLLSRINFK